MADSVKLDICIANIRPQFGWYRRRARVATDRDVSARYLIDVQPTVLFASGDQTGTCRRIAERLSGYLPAKSTALGRGKHGLIIMPIRGRFGH